MIWLIIILSFKSRQKAGGYNAVPNTKSEEKKCYLKSAIVNIG